MRPVGKRLQRRAREELRCLVVTLLLLAGCASSRHYQLAGRCESLATAKTFYVVVNGATERVDYDYLGAALIPGYAGDYEKYAKGRIPANAKPDVPFEILSFLQQRGKITASGPAELAPREGAIILMYEELWGWDMGDIIKRLTIQAFPASAMPMDGISVTFAEMTIFNTHPVAGSVVPAMMNLLFESTGSTQPTACLGQRPQLSHS